jgi:hypothetical protein
MTSKLTLQSLIKTLGIIPTKFETENGVKCEVEIKQTVQGLYSVSLWELKKDRRINVLCICYGLTENEAKEKFKQNILSIT